MRIIHAAASAAQLCRGVAMTAPAEPIRDDRDFGRIMAGLEAVAAAKAAEPMHELRDRLRAVLLHPDAAQNLAEAIDVALDTNLDLSAALSTIIAMAEVKSAMPN